MPEVALVGDPVGHSVSPAIHLAAFSALKLDWEYRLVRVPEGQLELEWPALARRFRGLNVTSPHKQEAARLADTLSPVARRCASVNTLTFGPGGAFGDSTDGAGFLAALRQAVGRVPAVVVLLGTGGGARAVAAALSGEGAEVRVVGRNLAAGEALATDLARSGWGGITFLGSGPASLATALEGAQLLVHATTVGGPALPEQSPIPDALFLDPELVVFDLVYWPRPTPLRRRAADSGCRFVDGLDMLVEQAALALEAWTGLAAPRPVMRQAAQQAIEDSP